MVLHTRAIVIIVLWSHTKLDVVTYNILQIVLLVSLTSVLSDSAYSNTEYDTLFTLSLI